MSALLASEVPWGVALEPQAAMTDGLAITMAVHRSAGPPPARQGNGFYPVECFIAQRHSGSGEVSTGSNYLTGQRPLLIRR